MKAPVAKTDPRPALYVHVPFCVKKCDYCAFFSLSLDSCLKDPRLTDSRSLDLHYKGRENRTLVKIYLEGLAAEMGQRQKDAPWGVSSLFIGGGTPTALTESELEELLSGLHNDYRFEAGIPEKNLQRNADRDASRRTLETSVEQTVEKTVEGNPGTLTPGKLSILRAFGINRFSLGVQSFDDELLQRVGRIHSADDARRSIKALRKAGFDNLNLDLMFGLPGQDLRIWQESLEEALSWQPEHLSLYGLMLEEGTVLYHRVQSRFGSELESRTVSYLVLPDDDLQADMYEWAVKRLGQAGYVRYETSNFAKPGYECRHNLAYWHGREYIGLGPGAVSFQGRVRAKNIEDVREYRECAGTGVQAVAEREALSDQELMFERVILGLRLTQGVELEAFARDFGAGVEDIYSEVLKKYEKQGILCRENGYLRVHPDYFFMANSILQDFSSD